MTPGGPSGLARPAGLTSPNAGDKTVAGTSISPISPATLWRRFMAVVYEAILLFGVIWFFGYAFSALAQFHGEPGNTLTAFQFYMLAILAIYYVGFWSSGRRTLPMKTLELRLQTRGGADLTVLHALVRFLIVFALICLPLAGAQFFNKALALLLLIPFFWALADRQKRTLYDVLAGTRLVYAPPAPASARNSAVNPATR